MKTPEKSAIYVGEVGHRRAAPEHAFRYRTAMCLLDLDEIHEVMSLHPLWSTGRGRPVQFRRSDYLGDPGTELKTAVRRRITDHVGSCADRVQLLTQLRTWGWCFNPISIYYCSDHDGRLTAAVASVTNTPWSERHDYVLQAQNGRIEATVPKALHVSPYIPMDRDYRFALSSPGEQIVVNIDVRDQLQRSLATELRLVRRPFDRPSMTALMTSYPFMAWRVSMAIYWQALRLWTKGAVFHAHPPHHATNGREDR